MAATGFFLMEVSQRVVFKEANNWPVTEGVIANKMEPYGNHPGSVYYEYDVNGLTYGNSVVYLMGGYNGPYDYVKAHEVGDIVQVHYDPNNPNNSFLEMRLNEFPLYGGIVSAALAIILAIAAIRSKRKNKSS